MVLEKIYLADKNQALIAAWKEVFADIDMFKTIQADFFSIEVDAMVSPANSFGVMDGGIDRAIRYSIGFDAEEAVQREIVDNYHGELPVGSAIIVKTKK